MLLFCPHCDDIVEIFGEPTKPMPQHDCGAVLEPIDPEAESIAAGIVFIERLRQDRFELTPAGVAALGQGS